MLREFREFAMKGNIVDLAVAVIIGGAFGAIISSFVDDVITPLLLTPALNAIGAKDIGQLTWGTVKYDCFCFVFADKGNEYADQKERSGPRSSCRRDHIATRDQGRFEE